MKKDKMDETKITHGRNQILTKLKLQNLKGRDQFEDRHRWEEM